MQKGWLAVFVILLVVATVSSVSSDDVIPEAVMLKSRTIYTKDVVIHDKGYAIIQLDGIPDEVEKQGLAARGVRLLEYLPQNSWIADVDDVNQLEDLGVLYVGDIKPEDKRGHISGSRYSVVISDLGKEEARQVVERYGEVLHEPIRNNVWEVEIAEDQIPGLLEEESVRWVQARHELMTYNDGSRSVIGVDLIQVSPYGLNGTNIVIGEWDAGWAEITHTALADRTFIGDALGCGGAGDTGTCGEFWHSTHVAGTLIGNGSGSNGLWGMAPNATLITYEWPDTYDELVNETNESISNRSVIVSQNSWGYNVHSDCSELGDYDLWSAYYDNLTIGNGIDKPILFVFAAGNERGVGLDGGGKYYCGTASQGSHVYNTTTGPGGTAKNTLVVGSVTKAGDMSSFSSWGPTDDGRIKPDVVAVGSNVNSTFTGNTYSFSSGTSMAAPAVSGLVALIYEDFRNYLGIQNPLPSTVKALIIHTAKDMNNTGPDYTTGWGLANATTAIDKLREDSNGTDVITEDNLTNGEDDVYYIYVPSGETEFKITIVWDDYPGSVAASKELVNDIDLVVTNSTGERVYPWTLGFDPSEDARQDARDDRNNVEQVYVANPASGVWTVLVNGTSVPQGPQNYSLVSSLSFDVPIVTQNTPQDNILTADSNVTFNCSTRDTSALENVTLYHNIGGWHANDTQDITGTTNSTKWNITGIADGTYTWNCLVYDNSSILTWGTNRTFIIDASYPSWSGNETNITSAYTSDDLSFFNITWTDTRLDSVFIQGNWSGSDLNYTPYNTSNSYEYNTTLPAGTFYWQSWANDTAGNLNMTDAWIFEVSKASVSVNLTLNSTDGDVNYETGETANLTSIMNVSGKNMTIYRNGTSLANGSTPLEYYWDTTGSDLEAYNITVIFGGDQNYTSSSDMHILITEDTQAPNISSENLFPPLITSGENITVSAFITDNFLVNSSEVWFNVSNTTWSVLVFMENVSALYNTSYNTTNLSTGIYTVGIFANDTGLNQVNTTVGSFEVAEEVSVSISILDYQGNQSNSTAVYIFYNNTQEERNYSLDNITNVTDSLPNGFWDIKIVSSFNVTYEDVNITNTSNNISMDDNITESSVTLPSNILVFARVVATETSLDCTGAQIELSYDNSVITSSSRVGVYACHSWDMSARSCTGIWENITENSTINTTSYLAVINTTNTSAFAVAEGYTCGDGIIDTGETCSTCPSDAGACPVVNANTGGGGGSPKTPEVPKTKELSITTGGEITAVNSTSFTVTVNNTGDVVMTNVSLEVDTDCDSCEIKIAPEAVDLEPNERQIFQVIISGRVYGTYNINFSVTSDEGVSNSTDAILNLFGCKPDDNECFGLDLMYCNAGNWTLNESCNYNCSEVGCIPKPMMCIPAAKRCTEMGLEVCNIDGSEWVLAEECNCMDGKCVVILVDYTYTVIVFMVIALLLVFVKTRHNKKKRKMFRYTFKR